MRTIDALRTIAAFHSQGTLAAREHDTDSVLDRTLDPVKDQRERRKNEGYTMTLQWYRRPRLVVLKPDASVLEAARAIEQNNIGAVVVQDRGRVVGIVTDRDLAVRALGRELDASSTKIADVMTPSPVTLPPSAKSSEAIRLMQDRNVRRIPLVEGERVVGMVTLDDLLLDEAAPIEELAAIVHAQIGEGGPVLSDRLPARRRSIARAEATLDRYVKQVQDEAGLERAEDARTALEVVAASIVRRLTPDEARDFIAQLPSLLHAPLRALPPGPDRSVTRESIEADLASSLGIDGEHAAPLLAAVARTISRNISPGEAEQVRGQLPKELQSVLVPPAASPPA